MHTLTLALATTQLTLSLLKDEDVVDTRYWQDEKNISEKLLPMVDDLLAAHHLLPKDIASFHVTSDVPENYTVAQIARTIAHAFTWKGIAT